MKRHMTPMARRPVHAPVAIGATALCVLALAACAPLPPRPSADTAESLTEALPQSTPAELERFGSAPADVEGTRELDTAAVTRRVLLRHPALSAARARLDVAELEAWLIGRPAQPMLRLMPMLSEGRFRLEALLMQPLAEFASRELRGELAQAQAERAGAELVAQVIERVIEAQRRFHQAIVAEHHAQLQDERVELVRQQLELVESRLRIGESEAARLIEAQALLAREQAMAAQSQRMRIDARAALADALGEPSAAGLRVPMELPPLLEVRPPASVETRITQDSPQIEAARLDLESAQLRALLLDHWSSRWMPSAGVGGMRGSGMSEQRLELEIALLAFGRPDIEVDAARARSRVAEAELEMAQRSRALEAERALAALEVAERAVAAIRASEREAQRQQRLARALLERGEGGIESLWTARLARIDAERARMEAEAAALSEALALQRVIGRFETTRH
jgi:cobalt-zinc-cadmium efflux system outer membrane protein